MGPVVAGTFYPGRPEALRQLVGRLLAEASPPPLPGPLRGLIVPHAGYVYSGPVAATAYRTLAGNAFEHVVVVGPSHFVWFHGVARPDAAAWATPLGSVRLAGVDHPLVRPLPEAFHREHSLEVQLPFLQMTLGDPLVAPLLTGDAPSEAVAGVLEDAVGDDTLLVVSSDLSHYHSYETARRLDRVTAEAVVERRPEALGPESACGRTGVQAALHLSRARGWRVTLLDLRNSGDTAGDRSRVVGYGAFALTG